MSQPADQIDDTGVAVRSVYERCFAAGEAIYDAGERGNALYVIQAGHVELTRADADGVRVVARYGPGQRRAPPHSG